MKKKTILLLTVCLSITTQMYPADFTYTDVEQAAWEKHKSEISIPLTFLASDAMASIQMKYVIDSTQIPSLQELCLKMERHKYLRNYIDGDAVVKTINKTRIENIYQDSIQALLIPANPDIAGRFLGYAVSLFPELHISRQCRDSIIDDALTIARRLRLSPCDDYAIEEMDSLKEHLTREQIEMIIKRRNASAALNRACQVWSDLEQAKLIADFDQNTQIDRAFRFYMAEMQIRDYYIGNWELINANLEDLYRHKPRIIKMHEGLSQREAIEKKHEEKVGVQFSW